MTAAADQVRSPERPAAGEGRSLVWVQRGRVGPTVYCFHALSGSAAIYGQVALQIGRDRPVRGLQAIGLSPDHPPDRSVDQMASRYAEEIAEELTPASAAPLFIGYSMGGVLAVETARRIGGDRPRTTVLVVDCDPLYSSDHDGDPWRILIEQSLDLDLPVERLAGLPVRDRLELVRAVGAQQRRVPARFSLDRLHTMLQVCQANERAAAEHVPSHYPGTVHVLRPVAALQPAGEVPVAGADPWSGFADRAVVHPVPADHHRIMGPEGYRHVAARARELCGG